MLTQVFLTLLPEIHGVIRACRTGAFFNKCSYLNGKVGHALFTAMVYL